MITLVLWGCYWTPEEAAPGTALRVRIRTEGTGGLSSGGTPEIRGRSENGADQFADGTVPGIVVVDRSLVSGVSGSELFPAVSASIQEVFLALDDVDELVDRRSYLEEYRIRVAYGPDQFQAAFAELETGE